MPTKIYITSPEEIHDFIPSELITRRERKGQSGDQDKNSRPEVVSNSSSYDYNGEAFVSEVISIDSSEDEDATTLKEGSTFLKNVTKLTCKLNERKQQQVHPRTRRLSPPQQRKSSVQPTSNKSNIIVHIKNLSKAKMPTQIQFLGQKQSPFLDNPSIVTPTTSRPKERPTSMEKLEEVSVVLQTCGKGFDNIPNDIWCKRLGELKVYYEKWGHCNVPQVDKANKELRDWLDVQRKSYKNLRQRQWQTKRKMSLMARQRIRQLEGLDMVWKPKEAVWYDYYALLQQFKETYGHCRPPHNDTHKRLAIWVISQRRTYRRTMLEVDTTGLMTMRRYELLNKVGMCWHTNYAIGKDGTE